MLNFKFFDGTKIKQDEILNLLIYNVAKWP